MSFRLRASGGFYRRGRELIYIAFRRILEYFNECGFSS
jgi:hypothetical protein